LKRRILAWLILLLPFIDGSGQDINPAGPQILFRGVVRDAVTASPLGSAQLFLNHDFITSADSAGTFSFRVSRNDTVMVKNLGYKPVVYMISDTLATTEIMAGIYLSTDTISIGEVIIIPKKPNLRSEILNSPAPLNPERENARYNMQLAAYQGKVGTGKLGDPASNYGVLRQQYSREARERGQISSNQMVSISPFTIIPVAYMLLKGFPEKPVPLKPGLTREELDQIHRKYLESVRVKK
jgi:hypothetical protein